MTDDLRDQIEDVVACALSNAEFDTRVSEITDALLARFAIAGELPEPSTEPVYTHGTSARWTDTGECGPVVYLSSEGQIESLGSGYWSTRKGDDPRPFAAALIAAYRKAQEQTHE